MAVPIEDKQKSHQNSPSISSSLCCSLPALAKNVCDSGGFLYSQITNEAIDALISIMQTEIYEIRKNASRSPREACRSLHYLSEKYCDIISRKRGHCLVEDALQAAIELCQYSTYPEPILSIQFLTMCSDMIFDDVMNNKSESFSCSAKIALWTLNLPSFEHLLFAVLQTCLNTQSETYYSIVEESKLLVACSQCHQLKSYALNFFRCIQMLSNVIQLKDITKSLIKLVNRCSK